MAAKRVPCGWRLVPAVFAGEHAACQREVRDEHESVTRAGVEHTEPFRPSPQQAVLVLDAHETGESTVGADAAGFVDLFGSDRLLAPISTTLPARTSVSSASSVSSNGVGRVRKVQLV